MSASDWISSEPITSSISSGRAIMNDLALADQYAMLHRTIEPQSCIQDTEDADSRAFRV